MNGAARKIAGCTPGVRDSKHAGKRPADFLREANGRIAARRAAGHGVALPEAHALLTLDEVLAVRLYSGAAYQPINRFLRQLATLSGDFRAELAASVNQTFCATVGHMRAHHRSPGQKNDTNS